MAKIEEKIPLKQGLKPRLWPVYTWYLGIEEKIPLKQGLKPYIVTAENGGQQDWREDSIKTRIETAPPAFQCVYFQDIEEKIPLKQGLKPSHNFLWGRIISSLKRRFH